MQIGLYALWVRLYSVHATLTLTLRTLIAYSGSPISVPIEHI